MRITLTTFLIGLVLCAGCDSSGNSDSDATGGNPDANSTDQPDCSGDCTGLYEPDTHIVTLEAAQVVVGSTSIGAGDGEIELDRATGKIQGTISLTGVDADSVTLNRGLAGQDGPVLLRFDKTSETDWALPATASLTTTDVAAMQAGGLYVIATSTQSPDGAVRGQVRRHVHVGFFTLFGSQVVPAVHSSATASSAITTRPDVPNTPIDVHVNVYGLEDVRSVHVHEGPAGENGPVLIDLERDSANPDHWFTRRDLFDDDAIAGFENGYCVRGGCDYTLYLDVHTGAYPDGELRAQLGWPNEVQFVSLSPDDVVPSAPSNRFGNVATTITDIVGWEWTLELTMNVNLQGIDDAASVTLNYAPVGQNGPVVYSLEQDPVRSNHWSGRTLLDEPVDADGHGWYFTVTTPDFPDGELRGQWSTQYNWSPHDSGWFGEAFEVSTVDPPDGSTIASMPDSLIVEFTGTIHMPSVGADKVELLASGGDAAFGDGNDLRITPLDVSAVDSTLIIEIGENTQVNDVYRLVIDGIKAGYADFVAAPRFISTFAVDSTHTSPTFAQLQQEIFTPNCAQAGCHGGARPAFGLNLSPGVSYAQLVDVPSSEFPGLDLVEPGDAEHSYLIRKMFRPWWEAHPAGQQRLSNASMQRLRQWIAEGAGEN